MTNYSVDKPSYGFTAATTQFDDALIRHGVINETQALVAKGASVQEAQRLLHDKQEKQEIGENAPLKTWYSDKKDLAEDDDNGGDEDDYDDWLQEDDILQRYRQLRFDEMKAASQEDRSRGIVESISRDEWTVKVNKASEDGTRVVICLTTNCARHDFLDACTVLAQRHRSNRFVTLPSKEALADWPHPEPSILVYKNGKLWREFFRLTALSVDELECTLKDVWDKE